MHAPLAEDSDVIEAATNLILACYILNYVSEDTASKLSNTQLFPTNSLFGPINSVSWRCQ